MMPDRYHRNLDAFKTILDVARNKNVKVLVYIAPIRNDVPIPYDADQYKKFKRKIRSLCAQNGVRFVNLENIIPGALWGTKDSTSIVGGPEYDFMHFKAKGHRILAQSLNEELSSMLNKGNTQ